MNKQGKYLLSLLSGTILLTMIFANWFLAWAENSSSIIAKKSHQSELKSFSSENLEFMEKEKIFNNSLSLRPTEIVELKSLEKRPLDKPLSRNDRTKHDVKIGLVKESKTLNQSRSNFLKASGDTEAKPISPSKEGAVKLKLRTQIGPIKRTSPVSLEQTDKSVNLKISEDMEAKPISPSKPGDVKLKAKPQIGPIKRTSPVSPEQTDKAPNLKISENMEAKPISPSKEGDVKLKARTQIGPIKRTSPVSSEQTDKAPNLKISENTEAKPISPSKEGDVKLKAKTNIGPAKVIEADYTQQRSLDKRVEISGETQVKSIENLSQKDNESGYKVNEGPIKVIETEKVERVQVPIKERLEVSEEIRAWRLDESGKKTDKESTIKTIERIMHPPPDRDK